MQRYGYPYRVETVGFPRCEIKPFQPRAGRKLLFVPGRPRRDGGRQAAFDWSALDFILDHKKCFESITICHTGQYDGMNIEGVEFLRDDLKQLKSPTRNMLERVDNADLVISSHTVAVLGVARGVPTIFYGESAVTPQTTTGAEPKHYDKYAELLQFPLILEGMTIDEVLAVREVQNPFVENWKAENIGGNFQADTFIKVVKEYV